MAQYPTFSSDVYAAVTPSDTLKLNNPNPHDESNKCRMLYVGGAGAVAVKDRFGNSVTFPAVPAGTQLVVSTDQVLSTGTAATSIVAIF